MSIVFFFASAQLLHFPLGCEKARRENIYNIQSHVWFMKRWKVKWFFEANEHLIKLAVKVKTFCKVWNQNVRHQTSTTGITRSQIGSTDLCFSVQFRNFMTRSNIKFSWCHSGAQIFDVMFSSNKVYSRSEEKLSKLSIRINRRSLMMEFRIIITRFWSLARKLSSCIHSSVIRIISPGRRRGLKLCCRNVKICIALWNFCLHHPEISAI